MSKENGSYERIVLQPRSSFLMSRSYLECERSDSEGVSPAMLKQMS